MVLFKVLTNGICQDVSLYQAAFFLNKRIWTNLAVCSTLFVGNRGNIYSKGRPNPFKIELKTKILRALELKFYDAHEVQKTLAFASMRLQHVIVRERTHQLLPSTQMSLEQYQIFYSYHAAQVVFRTCSILK